MKERMKSCESWAGRVADRKSWGLYPQNLSLSCQNLVLGFGLGERVGLAPDQIPAPGSALRSHPCVALSSAQANRSVRPERRTYKRPTRIGYKSHQAAKAISRILFHLPCKVAMES